MIDIEHAADLFSDEMIIMVGGFATIGTSNLLVNALVQSGAKNLTIISNDAGKVTPVPESTEVIREGTANIIATKRVKKLIASHVGRNPQVAELANAGLLEVELVPQGTLVERIRSGGAGLGGILTPTGIGTEVELGKK